MEEVSLDTQVEQVHLSTPKEVAEKAKQTEVGVHGEDKPKYSFKGYLCKVFGKWTGRFNFTVRW